MNFLAPKALADSPEGICSCLQEEWKGGWPPLSVFCLHSVSVPCIIYNEGNGQGERTTGNGSIDFGRIATMDGWWETKGGGKLYNQVMKEGEWKSGNAPEDFKSSVDFIYLFTFEFNSQEFQGEGT